MTVTTRGIIVPIATGRIVDWASFHQVFADALGFPAFYGRNMNAWVDCMTDTSDDAGMVSVGAGPGDLVVLRIDDAPDFARRCPELHDALVTGIAFVNYRQVGGNDPPLLALMSVGRFNAPGGD